MNPFIKFKFDIGQEVFFKTARNNEESRPNAFIVIHQMLIQGTGGTEHHYRLAGPGDDHLEALEIELTDTEPAYKAIRYRGTSK